MLSLRSIPHADNPEQTCEIYEQAAKIYAAPCGHLYCATCLREHVKHSIQQDTTFPVTCCDKEFAFKSIKKHLPPHIQIKYNAAAEQFAVPAQERVFCSTGCSTFLGSANDSDTLTCSKCKKATCTKCKGPGHTGVCMTPESALEELARSHGWQTCGSCKAVVELNMGCNHIL
jgi:hypothetical protein